VKITKYELFAATHLADYANNRAHDPDTPFFFRNFVEGLVRLFYLRSRKNLNTGMRKFEQAINEHIVRMMQGKKAPKGILPDEFILDERLKTYCGHQIRELNNKIGQLRSSLKPRGQFLTLDDLLKLLEVTFGINYSSQTSKLKIL
jgi:hypothetical protein